MLRAMPDYEIYALRYAHAAQSAIRPFLMPPNPHDSPVPMDFYVGAIRSYKHTIVVDTGFNEAVGRRRRPEWKILQPPDAALKKIGIDAATISDVVISHLDWDHSGNTALFPQAKLHVQDAEVAFRTGRYMTHPFFSQRAEIDDVLTTVRNVYAGKVQFLGKSLEEWQKAGHEAGSVVADPLFENADKRDFRLKPDSPAIKLGFKSFDFSRAGVYGGPAWLARAKDATYPPLELPCCSRIRRRGGFLCEIQRFGVTAVESTTDPLRPSMKTLHQGHPDLGGRTGNLRDL